ncbi:hypothetical protein PoB_002627400 [Plakobranchus ocellatus]|uniref:Uncharacterized protein n=1 Tax=Plakobranchus ocellatus TaxID=259542 RepID=A0AAV3ZZH1_9GAST|nr:hypothetical protein PoB_002627400 [Plakobranchus ocellatus]
MVSSGLKDPSPPALMAESKFFGKEMFIQHSNLDALVRGAMAHWQGNWLPRDRSEVRIPLHPALNESLTLGPSENGGDEESNGKLPQNAVRREQSGLYLDSA